MITRIIFLILTAFWMFIFLAIGISQYSEAPEQIARDKEFVKKEIVPSVHFIKKFKNENERLPTEDEFNNWQKEYYNINDGFGNVEYIRRQDKIIGNDMYKFKGANFEKDYAVGVWRGEWMEYYFSWNNKYDTNNYSIKDASKDLIIDVVIAFLPIIIFLIIYIRKRIKAAHNRRFDIVGI